MRNPLDARRLGIGIIPQELDLFPHLTVAENIVIGNVRAERGVMAARRAMDQFCVPLLRQVGLDCSPRQLAKDLPPAQRQLLAIASKPFLT